MPYKRSPLTYNGNKYRLLKQIMPLFPQDIDTFYDLFCESGVVSLNIESNKVIANDINTHLIEIFKCFQSYNNAEVLITDIDKIIKDNNLSKENEEAFYKFREKYNNQCLRIPMSDKVRSLNLSNTAALIIYDALRQQNFSSLN